MNTGSEPSSAGRELRVGGLDLEQRQRLRGAGLGGRRRHAERRARDPREDQAERERDARTPGDRGGVSGSRHRRPLFLGRRVGVYEAPLAPVVVGEAPLAPVAPVAAGASVAWSLRFMSYAVMRQPSPVSSRNSTPWLTIAT